MDTVIIVCSEHLKCVDTVNSSVHTGGTDFGIQINWDKPWTPILMSSKFYTTYLYSWSLMHPLLE